MVGAISAVGLVVLRKNLFGTKKDFSNDYINADKYHCLIQTGNTEEFRSRLRYTSACMNQLHRSGITTRIIRKGEPLPQTDDWQRLSPGERMEAVWELTILCFAWRGDDAGEPRLQRSISRVQRPAS